MCGNLEILPSPVELTLCQTGLAQMDLFVFVFSCTASLYHVDLHGRLNHGVITQEFELFSLPLELIYYVCIRACHAKSVGILNCN
jgi:hypothetical protein